ncbi:progressive ankylosis protein homolog isoform X2 [Watersipora subatra]|uniref:progressive ankylosis protein homolog isoform X2 n=1 Tax=Watersipora subatra TaxID=2589382 RepID=UPI00355B2F99
MADPTTKGVDQEELTRDEDKIAECNSDGKEIISHSFALNNACKDNSRDVVAIDDMEAAGLFGKFRKVRQFWMLLRFIAPLAVTQMVPDLAEQAINRGITSTASDEMVQLLASYGLAVYVTRWFAATASLTPAGTWLIRDIHGHNQEVSDLTNRLMTLLGPVPLIEALANYYEGGLIHFKLTAYAGIARFTDFGMQVLFVLLLLFTSKTIEPMFVPIYSVYAGYVARLILDAGFCYVLVRRKLPETHGTEKPLTVSKALRFWMPLACVRLVQDISRPLLNLVVSRNLSVKVGKEAAAKAIAVLTAVYPTGRFLFSWLNDLRTIPPTFHKDTPQHSKFKMKILSMFAFACTASVFTISAILFIIPGPGFAIMHTIVGLNVELAQLSLLPLKIFSGICLCVGLRAHLSGVLILKKKTFYLTPSAIGRLIGLIIFIASLSHTRLSGAVLGITVLLLSFVVEVILVVAAALLVRFKPNLTLTPTCLRKKNEDQAEGEEVQPLSAPAQDTRTRV